MSEVVEGVIVGEGSVLSMGMYIGQSTKIVNRSTGEITYGKIPPYSVVVPGTLPDKIKEGIVVRNSKKGESFEALDNKRYTLQDDMCVISDKSGVLGLGGIIGGARSGTELETRNILLESAYFNPVSIRKTSKLLNIDTGANRITSCW